MQPLQGKAVVITGAGRGIGAACARLIAELGGAVVVNDIDSALADQVVASIQEAGGKAVSDRSDITNWDQADALIEHCVSAFGSIDGLMNNAGLFALAKIEEMTEAHVRDLLNVNVCGTAFCGSHAARRMIRQGRGAIVNVTSGAHMGIAAMGAYGGTKGAVASMTYAWAMELQSHGIRVNALSPLAATRMSQLRAAYFGQPEDPAAEAVRPPEVNAPVVAYLLSDAAAGVTGQLVRIDGTKLSLLSHPAILSPVLTRDRWTFEAVSEAFETEFKKRQVPLGVVSADRE